MKRKGGFFMQFQYYQPVPLLFGVDTIKQLREVIGKIGGQKGILVCTPSLVRNGTAEQIVALSNGTLLETFSAIQPNPTVFNTDELIKKIQLNNYDFVVAVGGGSIMDCAKLARVVAVHEGSSADYLHKRKPFEKRGLPIITIPTTSGSASEVSSSSVVTDVEANVKAAIIHPYLFADYSIVDPRLTVSCPKHVTAVSGIDVLAHSIEAFYNINHQPFTDQFAKHAIRLALSNLEKACFEPENLEARKSMAEASVAAGYAFSQTGTAAAHACSYPLTQIFGVPHGEACALTLAELVRVNATVDNRLNELAAELGLGDANGLADRLDSIKQSIGLRMTLSEAGIQSEEDLALLIAESFAPNIANNPYKLDEQSLRELYTKIL